MEAEWWGSMVGMGEGYMVVDHIWFCRPVGLGLLP